MVKKYEEFLNEKNMLVVVHVKICRMLLILD